MEQKLTKQQEKLLLDALRRVKEDNRKRLEKEEAKRWGVLNVPLHLSDGLARFTKDELLQIARNLGINKLSQLKKQVLIDELNHKIPEHIQAAFCYFDQDRYRLMKKIVQDNGYTYDFKLEKRQIEYLYERGILFPGTVDGKRAVVMPQEVMLAFGQADQEGLLSCVQKNTEWIKLTHGLLYYYGTLNLNQLESMLEKYSNERFNLREYIYLLQDAASYYGEIQASTSGYSYYRVFDPEKVKKEHQIRANLDFYPFSKAELLQAGEPGFVDRNKFYRDFIHFILQHYEMTREEADQMAEECVYAANNGDSLNNIMEYLQRQVEFPHLEFLNEFVGKVVHLMNNTRRWDLKGYTPAELGKQNQKHLQPLPSKGSNVIEISQVKKTGRNDPCPCGSGKKFKKCCGN